MSPVQVGLIGIALLLLLLFSRIWIGVAMAVVGFLGFAYLGSLEGALSLLKVVPLRFIADYTLSVVPLFILMGVVTYEAGISEDLYRTAHKWLGQQPGGLAVATIGACAAFSATCGSSTACAVIMSKIALPEMKKYNYDTRLAAGTVAAGGTLGILIPPSLGFILYAILTESSVGMLFMAGIFPGLLLATLFSISIILITRRNEQLNLRQPKITFKEKIISLKHTGPMLALFFLVIGGLYMGVFTPGEAGAIGAFGAIVIGIARKRLSYRKFLAALVETGQTTCMMLFLLLGAMIFMRFMAISNLPFALAALLEEIQMSRYFVLAVMLFIYILLGMFLDIISSQILTIPIIFPVVLAMNFDPIWFGVLMIVIQEMGLITPPIGLNVFMVSGASDVPVGTIFAGVWPFVIAMAICIILIILFPQIALFLPNTMRV